MATRSLGEFVASVSGSSYQRIEHDFGYGYVRLCTSEAERRQAAQDIRNVESVVLELLRNACDAHARNIFIASSREGGKRSIIAIDDGEGIPRELHEHIFEPRVTKKLDTNHMDAWGMHGRGMALYSIKMNAERAYVCASEPGLGSSIVVVADSSRLSEKNDQSSFPTFELRENGTVNVRGPRNILRTACEFAIESRDMCSVTVGSPIEIASAMYALGRETLSPVDRAFCRSIDDLPLAKRLATAGDPETFADVARSLGLNMSTRSARRVLDGEIPVIENLLDQIQITDSTGKEPKRSRKRPAGVSAMNVKLDRVDSDVLADSASQAFAGFADKYYLQEDVKPTVRSMKGRIVISIPTVEKQ